ncbi:MAG: ankyrin repeat domain-containing protein [Pseudomonadota bacterium]
MNALNELLLIYADLPDWLGMPAVGVNTKGGSGDFPINTAATRGRVVELELLLEAGANINQRGEHGFTPLHSAVEQGHMAAVEWLLRHGADVNARNDGGERPVDLAVLLGEVQIADLLGVT